VPEHERRGPGPSVMLVPEGDTRPRRVCLECGFVHYRNPLVVVGAVCMHEARVLMCRRAIPPREGFWTIPAGYLELDELPETGARREALEEARAEIEIDRLLAVYGIARISQVQLIFAARLPIPEIAPGPESHEVALFDWDRIPWADLAFPSVRWALEDFRHQESTGDRTTRANPPGESGDW
jgi:ADP-ribose pyrophosphatase YjhB (NUDIX family)